MTKFLYTLVFTLCVLCMQAQTLWTGAASSDWDDPANWTAGVPTSGQTATLPVMDGGNSPTYSGSPIIDFTIQNAGTLTFNSIIFNNGTIINFGGGVIINENYFINAGAMVFDNDGILENEGIFDNYGTYEHAASAELNNRGTFNSLGDFNSNGPIVNSGTLNVTGKFVTTRKMQNSGELLVAGLVDFPFGSELENMTSGKITIADNSLLQINSAFDNKGELTNNGKFNVQSASVLTNNGTLTNNAATEISGQLVNESTFVSTNDIMIKSAGQLDNRGSFSNQAEITMEICAILIQNGGGNIGGSIQTDGLTYEINGTVSETNLEFGETFSDLSTTPSPVPACKGDVFFLLDESGIVEFTAEDIDRGRSYGACGAQIVEYSVSPTSFTAADAGVRIVELTITDNFGRTSSCEDFVTIVPFSEPITASDSPNLDVACNETVTATTLPGANFAEVSFPAPVATSTCSGMPNTTIDCSATPNEIEGFIFMGERNGSKYYCSNTNSLTWHQARDLAVNLGGHLAIVNDAAENEFIRSNILADYAWIGYTDEAQEGNFQWISGSSDYTNWRSGEPNNSGEGEDYTRILKNDGQWTDRNAQFHAEAVIEIPCPVVMETVSSCGTTPNEIDGFIFMGERNGSKYYCSNTNNLTWSDANTLATNLGGHLAIVNDAAENEFIRSNILADYAWIGYTDEAQEGNFQWVSGSSDYTNWRSGEPNNSGEGEDYARILKNSGEWTDRDAHFHAEAVIEIPCTVVPNTGSTICSLDNFGTEGIRERIVWIKFDNEEFPARYEALGENTFQEFSDGTALLTGRVQKLGTSNKRYSFSVKLENKRSYAEWTALGRLAKEESGGFGDPTTWSYYELVAGESTFTGEGAYSGEVLNLTHGPSDYKYGFQVGFGANVKDGSFGISGWWDFTGGRSGHGDFNADLNNCRIISGGNGEVTVEQIQGIQSGDNFPVGTTQIAYRITDDCGNQEICLFDVVVEQTPSALTLVNCPENIVIDAPVCAEGTTVTWSLPEATTTCYIDDIIVNRVDQGPLSGDFFPVGNTRISYIIADSCGNAETCVFDITVNEVNGELSVDCPADLNLEADRNTNEVVANFSAPTATTTSGEVIVRQLDGPESGQSLAIGNYTVIYLIADDCNNTEICSFNIVVDAPVIDDDNDGVPAEEDCDDNDASVPAAPGTACNDGNDNTENDAIDADGCTCVGVEIIDADGDGVRLEEDCDDNDASVPTTPGTACNDGNDNTENDVIGADGCSCGGDAIVDADGDGVRAEEDCDDNDASVPTIPGTACDDNNSLTENDIIGIDGCSCAGTLIPTCTVEGGEIAFLDGSTEQTICADDEIANPLAVNVFGPIGTNQQWVITDADLNILGLPTAPPFDLEGAGAGTCLIWSLSFEDGITGAAVGANAADLEGCFELSNPISVIRLTGADCPNFVVDEDGDGVAADEDCNDNDPSVPATPGTICDDNNDATENDVILSDGCSCAGTLIPTCTVEGGEIAFLDGSTEQTICADDAIANPLDVNLKNIEGTNQQWVITDADLNILGLPTAPPFDLEGAGAGTCLIWSLSFEDGITGATVGANAADLDGCFELSNPISVIRLTGADCPGFIVDEDGDGVPADEDCDDNDESVPATPGTACDDGNVNTENDVVTADGCGCEGTPVVVTGPDCDDISVTAGDGNFTVTGLDGAPVTSVQCFNNLWTEEYKCFGDCDATITVPVTPGSYRIFVKYYTASYQFICQVEEVIEVGVGQPIDADGDGIPAGEDCDDNDASVPATPGSACDDGNATTENDVVTADGCGCEGTDVTGPIDADGDGIPAGEDCDDNDASVPATPGTACDDGNANTENDVVTADGCGCEGTPVVVAGPDCDDISVTVGDASFTVSGLDGAPVTSVQCFNNLWTEEYKCFGDCDATITVPVTPGSYRIYVKYYTASYQLICQIEEVIEVEGNQPIDADGDGIPAGEDCDDNDASVPATPGSTCDDGNANTENDVVTADGCGCEGTDVTGPIDADGDGIPAGEDCDDNDASVPATPGTACDDGNANTENDVVTADGCGCEGTPVVIAGPDCDDISVTVGDASFTVSGLDGAPVTSVQCFNNLWTEEYKCFGDCDATITVPVTPGSYRIYVKYYTASYQLICQVEEVIEVEGNQPVDADGDGVPADEDCDDNDASIPATSGTVCNDGDDATINDVILANGCDCAGTEVIVVDNDNDGVPADEDCNDNDASVPATPGTACDDNNDFTINDVILIDGCNCGGTLFVDNDNDGVPADEDCDDNDPNFPATPGTACNDNNPGTSNDLVTEDGCGCEGKEVVETNCNEDCYIFRGNIDSKVIGNSMSHSEDRSDCRKKASSTRALNLDAGATVERAFLQWSGSGQNVDSRVTLNGEVVDANRTFTDGYSNYHFYGAYADVTDIVKDYGSADYTVRNLTWDNSGQYCHGNAAYGAWTLVVVYSDDALQSSAVHVCQDQFEFTFPQGTYTNSVSCIDASVSCASNAELTIVTFEGDGYKGEHLNIGGQYYGDNNFCSQTAPNLDIASFDVSNLVTANTNTLNYQIESYRVHTRFGWAVEGLIDFVKVLKYDICEGPGTFAISPNTSYLHLNANKNERAVALDWISNNDYRTAMNIVERSENGSEWTVIEETLALTQSTDATFYQLRDEQPNMGVNHYRVKQVFTDGTFIYSNFAEVRFDADPLELVVYPNPALESVNVSLREYAGMTGTLTISNALGQQMTEVSYDEIPSAPVRIELDRTYNAGTYTITVDVDGRKPVTKIFLVGKL